MISHRLRVGVVGAGESARHHVAAWRALSGDVNIYSPNSARELAKSYGLHACNTLRELLEGCDIVDVCTPTFLHSDVVLAAAAAGRSVICEKPLARTHSQAVAMIAACEQAGTQIFPAHVVRFMPEYATARRAVQEGRIGEPAVMRFSRRTAAPKPRWFSDEESSGGILVDQMIHDIDFARWVAGDVSHVYAHVAGGRKAPTTATAILTHESGALSHVSGTWGHPDTVFRTAFSLAGSHGIIEHDSNHSEPLVWDLPASNDRTGDLFPPTDHGQSPYLAELEEFRTAFMTGPAPRVNAADGLAALDIALAALESANTGRAIKLKEVAG